METVGSFWMWVGFAVIVLFKIPVLISLGVVTTIIATSIALSLRKDRQQTAAMTAANAKTRRPG
jgi:hypothetical protein